MSLRLLQLAALAVLFVGVTSAPAFLPALPISMGLAVALLWAASRRRTSLRAEALSAEISSFLSGEPEAPATGKRPISHYSLRERMRLEAAVGEEGDSWFFEKFK